MIGDPGKRPLPAGSAVLRRPGRAATRFPQRRGAARQRGRPGAYLMSFSDIFVPLTILFAGLAMFALLKKKPEGIGGGGGH